VLVPPATSSGGERGRSGVEGAEGRMFQVQGVEFGVEGSVSEFRESFVFFCKARGLSSTLKPRH
jgi:hypothetical protein